MSKQPNVSLILYATDLGKQTRPVIRHAMAIAKQYDAKILMVHVAEPMSNAARDTMAIYLSKELTDEVQRDVMQQTMVRLQERLEKFYAEECDLDSDSSYVQEAKIISGKPSEEILRIAEEEKADLIVMGKSTRKVRGIRVMGGTARRVSRMSKVPVLVVPNY
jgi:nucleotide-binding universal stress UspA family protein